MADVNKSVSITMASNANNKTVIHCGGLQKGEVASIRTALDSTQLYKSTGYSVISEDTTFTDKTMELPAAINMTGKRDSTIQIKMTNDKKQNLFMALECPVDLGDTTALNTWIQSKKDTNITGFGTVKEVTYSIKN